MSKLLKFIDDGKKKTGAIRDAFTGPLGATGSNPYYYPPNRFMVFRAQGVIAEGDWLSLVPNDYRSVTQSTHVIPYYVGIATHAAKAGGSIEVQVQGIYNTAKIDEVTGGAGPAALFDLLTFHDAAAGQALHVDLPSSTHIQLCHRAGIAMENSSGGRATVLIGPFVFCM